MALGIISDKEFNKEVDNSSTDKPSRPNPGLGEIITSDVLRLPTPGRHNDVGNIPPALRKVLGESVATEGIQSAMALANAIGTPLSQPSLSTYARGESSPNRTNDELLGHIRNRKTKLSNKALNKLSLAMSLIDESKLMGLDAKDLSSVAKDMATVSKHMEPPPEQVQAKDPVQFHFYAPQVRNENHYETVVAKDNY